MDYRAFVIYFKYLSGAEVNSYDLSTVGGPTINDLKRAIKFKCLPHYIQHRYVHLQSLFVWYVKFRHPNLIAIFFFIFKNVS